MIIPHQKITLPLSLFELVTEKHGQTSRNPWILSSSSTFSREASKNKLFVQPRSSVTPRVSGESLSAEFYQILIFWFFEFLEFCQIHSTGKWISHNQTRHGSESRANQPKNFKFFLFFAIKTFLNLSETNKNEICIKFRIDNRLATFQTDFFYKKTRKAGSA